MIKEHQNSLFCDCHVCDPGEPLLVAAMRRAEGFEAEVKRLNKVNAKFKEALRLICLAADIKGGALMKPAISKIIHEAFDYETFEGNSK